MKRQMAVLHIDEAAAFIGRAIAAQGKKHYGE
jgi:hypothetical protein